MSMLEQIRPQTWNRVIDLVQEAGVDITDWANYSDGTKPPAANPRYCYEWSFIQPDKCIVLNVWFDDLVEQSGSVTLSGNMRKDAARHARPGGKSIWSSRGEKFDKALQFAAQHALPVRLIICTGRQRRLEDPEQKASRVAKRELDASPWTIVEYDQSSGRFLLERGLRQDLRDQFDLPESESSVAELYTKTGVAYKRQEAVRRAVLARALGRCEWCNQPAFELPDGSMFLETHHVVPLSQGGADHPANVTALCPNHHREAHLGVQRDRMREQFQARLQRR